MKFYFFSWQPKLCIQAFKVSWTMQDQISKIFPLNKHINIHKRWQSLVVRLLFQLVDKHCFSCWFFHLEKAPIFWSLSICNDDVLPNLLRWTPKWNYPIFWKWKTICYLHFLQKSTVMAHKVWQSRWIYNWMVDSQYGNWSR